MPIKIISIGKKHEPWLVDGIERYQKRLKRPFEIQWGILPHSAQAGVTARRDDSQRILTHLNANDYVILLDECGETINSQELASRLVSKLQLSQGVTIIIGGAYGVDESIHNRANFVWSLSSLVFPHQLVRLILTEQLYRAQQIANGHPYHHN